MTFIYYSISFDLYTLIVIVPALHVVGAAVEGTNISWDRLEVFDLNGEGLYDW
jgi:hypothetical protein